MLFQGSASVGRQGQPAGEVESSRIIKGRSLMALSWNGDHKRLYAQAVTAALVLSAILLARSSPPNFPPAPWANSSIRAITHHDERPRFEHNRAQWSNPESTFQCVLPALHSRQVAATLQSPSTVQSKGRHYNRPPPLRVHRRVLTTSITR